MVRGDSINGLKPMAILFKIKEKDMYISLHDTGAFIKKQAPVTQTCIFMLGFMGNGVG